MEVVKAFNNELSSLYEGKPPISKAKMTQVTRAAIKGLKFYKHIVQSVEKFIQKCRPEYKVPGLYVIDSIVRQSRHQFGNDRDVFVPRFSKNIVLTFQYLYKCPVEERPRIVRVLNIWQKNNVFPTEVIQPLLDMANAENPGAALSSSQPKSEPDEWKSWNASSQAGENTITQTQTQKTDSVEDHVNDHDLHPSGVSVFEGRGGGGVKLNSGIMSQLQELTSQLLNNNSGVQDPPAPAPPPQAPTPVTQSPVKPPAKEHKDENTVKFNKKLLDFDYGEEEEEDEMEEEDKEENGHAAPTEPTALALSMAQNLLSNPDLLRQLQQMQQTIQQTEAFNASLTEPPTPQQQPPAPPTSQLPMGEDIPLPSGPTPHHSMSTPEHHSMAGVEEPRSHLPHTENSYCQLPPPPGRINTPIQSHMPAIYSDITMPMCLPPLPQPSYPGPAISAPMFPPMNNTSVMTPTPPGMCASPIQQQQQAHLVQPPPPVMMDNVPLPPMVQQSEAEYHGSGGMLHSMPDDDISSNSMVLQDRDDRSIWAPHTKDEDERVIPALVPLPKADKSRSRSRSRSPVKGSSSSRSSNRSSSRRSSSRRSRSRSPRRKRDSSRSPTSGSSSRHSRRGDDSRSRSDSKRSSSQSESFSSRDPEKERERERDRERRHKGLPPLRKGFLAVCSTTLWLGHVPKITSEASINDIFCEYGTVINVDLIPSRGCAYVLMERRQDALWALQKLRNLKVQGSLIKMAWAPGKGVKGKEFKEYWDVEQGVTFIPHEKVDMTIDLEALQEGGVLDVDSLPDKLKELYKNKALEADVVPKDLPTEPPIAIAPQIQQTPQVQAGLQLQPQQQPVLAAQPIPVSDAEQQQAAILASAASGVAAAASAVVGNQINQSMVPPQPTLQQQFNLPMPGMIPSQALMIPQMSLPLGVPPPNSMVLMSHNSIGGPGGQQMAVLNALAASSGLPPGANPAAIGGPMGLLDASDRSGDDKLSAALVSNPAIMGGFPPHMAGFPPGHFPPGARPPMHPNHMMGGPHWPPGMPGHGTFIRPPGAPALQQFGRLMTGPMPRSPQNMFNPQGPPARGTMIPGFGPVGQPPPPIQQQQQAQTATQPTQPPPTTAIPTSQAAVGQEVERKMSPTLLEQEYNRFVATKGVNNPPVSRNNFMASPGGTTTTTTASGPSATAENPNMEPLGSRLPQAETPMGQGMLGSNTNMVVPPGGQQGPVPGPDMGFRHPRPQMGFGNPRGGSPQGALLSPQGAGGAMGMNRFPFPGIKGQRPFMRGRGMEFRGPRPGFGGDWGRPPHMGRDPYYEMDRDYPMNRRDWDMDPDRQWGGPHGEMDNRFMNRGRMDEDYGGPRSRDDEFGMRQRDGFGRPRDDFGGPRKRDDFGRQREDFGGPRGRDEFPGPRNREEFGGQRSRENDHQRNRDEEFSSRNRDEEFGAQNFENGRWGRGQDSYRDNFDLRENERDSERDRSRRRDRDRDQSRESDRDKPRDSERHDRDSDRDRDREQSRDRDRDRDGDRKRGRERRERTRWNRSSSREKEQGARPADVESTQSTTETETKDVVQPEQPMETEPVAVVPAIPDSVFKAPLPVLDIPAPTSKAGSENGDPQLKCKSSPSHVLEESQPPDAKGTTDAEEDNPKVNRFAFPDEPSFLVAGSPPSTEPVHAEEAALDSAVANRINSEPFAVNPDGSSENVVRNIVSVDPETTVQEPVENNEPAIAVAEECPQ